MRLSRDAASIVARATTAAAALVEDAAIEIEKLARSADADAVRAVEHSAQVAAEHPDKRRAARAADDNPAD